MMIYDLGYGIEAGNQLERLRKISFKFERMKRKIV
jgi:hypothetical protein